MSIHYYQDITTFSSIYVENGNYYVCGKANNDGIILERDIMNFSTSGYKIPNIPLFKIIGKNNGLEAYVVGTNGNDIAYMHLNTLPTLFAVTVRSFQTINTDNVSISNFPLNRAGMIISTAMGDSVYLYFLKFIQIHSHHNNHHSAKNKFHCRNHLLHSVDLSNRNYDNKKSTFTS